MIFFDKLKNKKEAIVEKAKQLKDEHNIRQRKKKDDWLFKKEIELKKIEEKLNEREKIIRQKEAKLSQKFFLRFIILAGCFSLIGIFVLLGMTLDKGYISTDTVQTNGTVQTTKHDVNDNQKYKKVTNNTGGHISKIIRLKFTTS
jgi:hypothetical protein